MVVDERSVIGGPTSVLVKDEDGSMTRYRRWNPYTCMLAAAILNGVEYFGITKGATVLYLGVPASAITVSHVSDIVGRDGKVYAVVYLHNSRGYKFYMARMQAFNDMTMIRENFCGSPS
ncbi:mediator of RNA polymerase II transcription subunit 36a-like [Papaver somniferum]|uniref:mediator of RNA polymerase II transcription subunit 36a-like n=1 Tax=Papaver somniferum TaxID=3469 RepID=UPI000E6F5D43|nr:mediator of RNA polymerase II transcription subunit 36a-like [Papaver somniferum]